MNTLVAELENEGYPVEFVVVADSNASDFVSRTVLRIFKEAAPGRPAWNEMQANAVKHDTFIYSRTGERVLFWDRSENNLANWNADIRAAVEAQGL